MVRQRYDKALFPFINNDQFFPEFLQRGFSFVQSDAGFVE